MDSWVVELVKPPAISSYAVSSCFVSTSLIYPFYGLTRFWRGVHHGSGAIMEFCIGTAYLARSGSGEHAKETKATTFWNCRTRCSSLKRRKQSVFLILWNPAPRYCQSAMTQPHQLGTCNTKEKFSLPAQQPTDQRIPQQALIVCHNSTWSIYLVIYSTLWVPC